MLRPEQFNFLFYKKRSEAGIMKKTNNETNLTKQKRNKNETNLTKQKRNKINETNTKQN